MKAPLGALKVEAKAMEEEITFAWDMGIRDCIFESDALTIVNAMLRLTNPPSSIANNIASSFSHLYQFHSIQFSHVPRSGNKVAHTLAQLARAFRICMLGLRKHWVVLRNWCPKMYYFCLILNKSYCFTSKKLKLKLCQQKD